MSDVPPTHRASEDRVCFFDLPVELVDKIFAHLSWRELRRYHRVKGKRRRPQIYFDTWAMMARVSRHFLPLARRALYGEDADWARELEGRGRDSFPRYRSSVFLHLQQIGPYLVQFPEPLRPRNESGTSLATQLSYLTNATFIDLGILPVDAYNVGVAVADLPLLRHIHFTIPPTGSRETDEAFQPKQIAAVRSFFAGLQSSIDTFWPAHLTNIKISAFHPKLRGESCVRERPKPLTLEEFDEDDSGLAYLCFLEQDSEGFGAGEGDADELLIWYGGKSRRDEVAVRHGLHHLMPALIHDIRRLRMLEIWEPALSEADYPLDALFGLLRGNRLRSFRLQIREGEYDTADLPPSFYALFPDATELVFPSDVSMSIDKLALLGDTSRGLQELRIWNGSDSTRSLILDTPELRCHFEQELLDVLGRMKQLEEVYLGHWPYHRRGQLYQLWQRTAVARGVPI